ncbi:MAG: hypothetical protein Q9197_002088 [Variospora fuerteventurae]
MTTRFHPLRSRYGVAPSTPFLTAVGLWVKPANVLLTNPSMPDDKTSPAPEEQKFTGYVPGNDSKTRWGNYFRYLSGQMTQEGKRQMKIARDDREEEADCARCEKQRDYLLMYSV